MPYGDMTGPGGRGPKTGRGMGVCGDSNLSNFTPLGFGRGIRRGANSNRRGYRRDIPFVDFDEKEVLKEYLKQIEKRLKELESK